MTSKKLETDQTSRYKFHDSYYHNFSTHQNITSVCVSEKCQFKLSTLRLEKLEKLEELTYEGMIEDEQDLDSLKAILDLPTLKTLNLKYTTIGPSQEGKYHRDDYQQLDFNGSLEDKNALNDLKAKLDLIEF